MDSYNLLQQDRRARQTGDLTGMDFNYDRHLERVCATLSRHEVLRLMLQPEHKCLNNVIIAGGLINGIIDGRITNFMRMSSDVDCFFYGLSVEKSHEILFYFQKLITSYCNLRYVVKRSSAAVTFYVADYTADDPEMALSCVRFQFITALFPSPEAVLLSFDIGCAATGLTRRGDKLVLLATPLAKYCIANNVNVFDPLRGSYNTFKRFQKYNDRGYVVEFPELNHAHPDLLAGRTFQVSRYEKLRFLGKTDKKYSFRTTLNIRSDKLRAVIEQCPAYYSRTQMKFITYDESIVISLINDPSENESRQEDFKHVSEWINLIKLANEDYDLLLNAGPTKDVRELMYAAAVMPDRDQFRKLDLSQISQRKLLYFADVRDEVIEYALKGVGDPVKIKDKQFKLIEQRYQEYLGLIRTRSWISYEFGTYGSIFGAEPITPETFYGQYYKVPEQGSVRTGGVPELPPAMMSSRQSGIPEPSSAGTAGEPSSTGP